MQDLDWAHMQSFVRVAQAGSLSAAAQRWTISQPSLSRHITSLENGLGVALFDRQPRGLTLTPTGTDLLHHAESMQAAANRLVLSATGRSEALAGTVSITASQIMATCVLPPILSRLRREEPGIEVEIVATNQTGNLLQREADIAVRMYRPTQSEVITRHVIDLDIAAFAAASYLASHDKPASLEQLDGHTLIGYDRDDQILRGFREAGLTMRREDFALRCDDQVTCWHLVKAGCGIGFMASVIGAREPDVQILFDGQVVAVLPVWLTAHAELRTSARVRRVYDFLGSALEQST